MTGALLLACFVLSGASGLVLEVVWTRQLAHVFGSTTLAISTVLATFMGGLALGSWLGGRVADRLRGREIVAYGVCELGVAAFALVIPLFAHAYPYANAWLWRRLGDHEALLALARFGLCALLLLPPTTLMGATLPLLARHAVRRPEDMGLLGRRVGTLYAADTLGAVVGAGSAGFWLVPTLGLARTNHLAVAVDVVLATGVFVLARATRAAAAPARATAADEAPPAPPAPIPVEERRLALVAFALSGAIAMTLEVLWSRALALVIGSSTYSFTIVLVVFLFGLAAGAAWIGRRAARSPQPLTTLAFVFLAVAAAVGLTHRLIDELPTLFLILIERTNLDVGAIIAFQVVVTGVAVLPAALCLGAVMPLAVRAYAGSPDAVGRDVGRAYAANTTGAILGSFAGGFVVMPLWGMDLGVRGCALAEVALAGVLLARVREPRLRRLGVLMGVAVALLALTAPRWNIAALTSGVFRIPISKKWMKDGRVPNPTVVYHRDGVSTTVTVERHGERLSLKNNGKTDASSWGDMPTQVLLGLLPVLLHEGTAQRVFVVGWGSGVTVGAAARSPDVARVDAAEIEPAVLEAADRFFSAHNHRAHEDPKVRRFVGDARHLLVARGERYDVIVSEPSNPWMAGVASLFSAEFYAFAKRHLEPGGIFCQWVQIYEIGPRNLKTIYRTFHEAFPYVYAFAAEDAPADTLLVGTLAPLPLDLARLEQRMAAPEVKRELERAEVRSVWELLSLAVIAPDEIPAFAAGGDLHTDDNAVLEFSAPRDLFAGGREALVNYARAITFEHWPYGDLGAFVTGLGKGEAAAAREAALGRALLRRGRRRQAVGWLERARARGAAEAEALLRVATLAAPRAPEDVEMPLDAGGASFALPRASWFDAAVPLEAREQAAQELRQVGIDTAEGRWADALARLERLPSPAATPEGDDMWLLRGFLLYKTGRLEDARRLLNQLAADTDLTARRPATWYFHGRVLWALGYYAPAVGEWEELVAARPDLVPIEWR